MELEGAAAGGAGAGCGSPPGQEESAAAAAAAAGKKVGWSKDEDKLLRELVRKHERRDWAAIAAAFPGRTDKSCRLRWTNHLDPRVNVAQSFTPDEDKIIVEQQRRHGNRWATIATYLPGRTDNAIKNRWNTHLRKSQSQATAAAADGERLATPSPCLLPLFPLTPGFNHIRVVPPIGENFPGPARSAVPECLQFFPLSPGDLRDDNASAKVAAAAAEGPAAMDVDSEGVSSFTELRLAPPAAVVFDAMPIKAIRLPMQLVRL